MQHLCDLQDAIPCHWSLGTSHSPLNASATDLRVRFLLSGIFTLYSFLLVLRLPCGASSSSSKLAGLHADHQNIVPAQLLCRMTAIHKRGILEGSIYVPKISFEVRVPQPWNLPLMVLNLRGFDSHGT